MDAEAVDALAVVRGVVRKRGFSISLKGAPEGPSRSVRVSFLRNDEEIGAATAHWPADFRFVDAANPHVGKTSIPLDEALVPIADVRLTIDKAEPELGPDWNLEHLYASSEHQFVRYFFRAKARMQDRETQMFAARQLVERYRKTVSHRCVAAVLYAYCAMDVGDAAECRLADEALDLMLHKTHRLEATDNGRTDRIHLTISMLCAAWQLALYRGDGAAFEGHLAALTALARDNPDPLPSVIQNACLSLSLQAYLLDRAGRTEAARDLAVFNAAFYAGSLVRMKPDAISFQEAIRAQSAVVVGLQVRERKRDQDFADPAEILPVLVRATRPPTLAVLTDRLTRYLGRADGGGLADGGG